ncbi:hypothetical protein CC78DRAFT_469263 [Lojkania enalia]|uniref:AAA+ ATPase domain-containing protein n=1 Tax=Lojkania enalia TaxID=147567 RepID=A0A9P4K2R7_9PLEO|nr:hypothetical protein CC78DRAFT_469263 [Didymosphaeria enalia]
MQSQVPPTATNGANDFSTPPLSPPHGAYRKGDFNRVFSSTSARPASGTYSSITQVTRRANNGYKIGFVQDTAHSLKKKSMAELGAGVYQSVSDVSFINFVEWIRSERLTTLPHKGSRWDKVLIRALYFAEQLHKFDAAIKGFALDSSAAASLGYGHAQLLLELGHENSKALDNAFTVFYKFSLSFSSLLHRSEILAATSEIREQLCLMYTDMLSLVVDVAIRFYKTVKGMTTSFVSLDIFDVFGDTIDAFRSRQTNITELIWSYQIENEGLDASEVLDVKTLSRWLTPQDQVLSSLGRDHLTFADNQAEFTCIWFQKPLAKFVQSDKKIFLITGQPGSGKTVLAGSIVERLQRPIGRLSFDSLFVSISSGIPSQATSLAVVKSLLFQLLNLRIGNIAIYQALSRAYGACHEASDVNSYEDHLWKALADSLKRPVEDAKDLVLIIDGIDELSGSQPVKSSLFERLVQVTTQGKRARLIALASALSLPASTYGEMHEIIRHDIRDDIHAVALKALIRNSHFYSKPPPEQESLLDQIIQAADGSFLWAILACEILCLEKSLETFNKSLGAISSSQVSVPDLVVKLLKSLEPKNNAMTLLAWLLAAQRPFTIDEIRCLFSIDVQRGTVLDSALDINFILQSLQPLLSIQDCIVRFRHPLIQSTLHSVALQEKISIPIKESQLDLVLRLLSYAKYTLKSPQEPILDNLDPTLAERLFRQHHFLEYAVRYWVFHFKESSLAPKASGEFKPSADFQNILPNNTTLPILEQLCWDTQLPTSEILDLHILVGRVRRQIFTENHPAVLQTYLTIATSYSLTLNLPEAQHYYYLSTKISRSVLSDIHPLTLECAMRYLRVTESMITTTRTEVMTHREEILILLIAAYEKQYGATSEIVIRTRKLLAEFYISIKEEHRAMEIYRLIQEATIKHYGKDSHEARDVHHHLSIVLGKGKDDLELEAYKESFFGHDDDDEGIVEAFDIYQITIWLRRTEDYLSRGEVVLAEKTYVELWKEVSSKCRTMHSLEWHEHHIEIALAYSRFLQSQKRSGEASAVLICVWQQYEHHQLSFAESIVTRLTSVAKTLKSMGHYTVALSVFKFASSYYKNIRREESNFSAELLEEISSTSTELVKQSLTSTTTVTETTSTISESIFQDVFQSVITSSKAVDMTTISLSKKLTAKYIEQKNWSAATTVIEATLQKTWKSFFSDSIHNVTLISTFLNESIELVERLAECYLEQKQLEKVEDVYVRLFRAVLASPKVDRLIFEKARNLLLGFYDKRGYTDNSISVYQEILVAYRNVYGPTHEYTIQTLYTLAARCQAHPRNHPYWIEYYLQIVTSLNKDSDICHKDALGAIIIVATTYWEDRRYAEAVIVFSVLWNTFVQKTKAYKQFTEATFVTNLYERYFQCLEETKASWEVLHEVTIEYRKTCVTTFGAESTIAVEATLSLARITQRSEEHSSQAISLYEEVSKSSKVTSTKVTEIKQMLSSLYVLQITKNSSSKMSSETIQQVVSLREQQFSEAINKYGYSHESSLTHLHELAILYTRQQKSELALKQLTTAVTQTITKEVSSQKLIESATSIATTFQACQLVQQCTELVEELHVQLCGRYMHNTSKWSFDLTKCDRSALAFLAALEYHVRKDFALTLTEIMAEITTEWIYYEQYRRTMKGDESVKNILLAAAPLRSFLTIRYRTVVVGILEDEIVKLFMNRDAADLKVLGKDSPRIFIVSILERLGNRKSANFNRVVILASNDEVASLTKSKKWSEAYDIAHLAFIFATNHDGYNGPNSIGLGFRLASLLVGSGEERCPEPQLRKKSLELSNRIVKNILEICKKLELNFAQIQLSELSQLSVLLGEQHDYGTLEWLLTTLWNTRDAQRAWPAEVLVNLGRRLICARYLAGHPIKAIRLCEDIAYNMRRTHGTRAAVTLETYDLLAHLYTSTGHMYQSKAAVEKTGALAHEYFKKAIGVHEDILHWLVNNEQSVDNLEDDEFDTTTALLAEYGIGVNDSVDGKQNKDIEQPGINKSAWAIRHLYLLKLAYQRYGGWPKPVAEYERLNAELFRVFGGESEWKDAKGVETWDAKGFGAGKAEGKEGAFEGVDDWAFAITEKANGHETVHQNGGGVNGRLKVEKVRSKMGEDDEEL